MNNEKILMRIRDEITDMRKELRDMKVRLDLIQKLLNRWWIAGALVVGTLTIVNFVMLVKDL